jgi:hypothetical protein
MYSHNCFAESGDQWWITFSRAIRPFMGSVVAAARIVNPAILDFVDPPQLVFLRDVNCSNL